MQVKHRRNVMGASALMQSRIREPFAESAVAGFKSGETHGRRKPGAFRFSSDRLAKA
jgi:hypothetical protein